jgi:THO complex subunit 3
MKYGRDTPEAAKETWRQADIDPVSASRASFNHSGDGIVASFYTANTIKLYEYPSLIGRESPAAHVGGCQALALDPRGL